MTTQLLDGWWWVIRGGPDAAAHRLWQGLWQVCYPETRARTLCGVQEFAPMAAYDCVADLQAFRPCWRCEAIQHRYEAK